MKHPVTHISRPVFLLVALIIFQGVGWLLAWQIMEWQAKAAAQSALFEAETPVREVILQQDFFQQSKVGKYEILLNGNLFDIRSSESVGDSVRLVLYHDKAEEGLYSVLGIQFTRSNHAQGGESHPLSLWLAQCIGLTFILPKVSNITLPAMNCEKAVFFWHFSFDSESRIPPFTPPRIVLALVH